MSHAWLFTGPPGSGRSNAAVAFAARPAVRAGRLRHLPRVPHRARRQPRRRRASSAPSSSRSASRRCATWCGARLSLRPDVGWQILIVEDADRLTEQAANALLKAIEEPTVRTVWMLCAPTVEDVLPTIRSRCRQLTLATPTAEQVAEFLVRTEGVGEALAAYAARASQGHIGRARALACDEATRNRRREVVSLPARLTSLGACMHAATNLAEVAKEEAEAITGELDAREKADLDTAYGVVERGRRPREYAPALVGAREGAEDPRQAARHSTSSTAA